MFLYLGGELSDTSILDQRIGYEGMDSGVPQSSYKFQLCFLLMV